MTHMDEVPNGANRARIIHHRGPTVNCRGLARVAFDCCGNAIISAKMAENTHYYGLFTISSESHQYPVTGPS